VNRRGRATARAAAARAFTLLEIMIVIGVILTLMTLVLGVGSALLRNAEKSQVESSMAIMESALNEYEAQLGRQITFNGAFPPSDIVNGSNPRFPMGLPLEVWPVTPPAPFDPLVPAWRRAEAVFDVRDPGVGRVQSGPIAGPAMWAKRARGAGVYAVGLLSQVDSVRPILSGISPGLLRPEAIASTYPPGNLPQSPSAAATILYPPSARSSAGSRDSTRAELVDPWGNRIAFVFPGRTYRFGADSDLGLPDPDGTVRTQYEQVFGVCANRRICLVSAGPDGLFGLDGEGGPLNGNSDSAKEARAAVAADNVYLYPLDPSQ
jgi:type II secretory pathway pseudopilin PulG